MKSSKRDFEMLFSILAIWQEQRSWIGIKTELITWSVFGTGKLVWKPKKRKMLQYPKALFPLRKGCMMVPPCCLGLGCSQKFPPTWDGIKYWTVAAALGGLNVWLAEETKQHCQQEGTFDLVSIRIPKHLIVLGGCLNPCHRGFLQCC